MRLIALSEVQRLIGARTERGRLVSDGRSDASPQTPKKPPSLAANPLIFNDDPGGSRTRDLRIKSPLLYQLSYRVECFTH